ncbi:MAG: AAA family ATPase [Candidatus Omnitrophota bacterium]
MKINKIEIKNFRSLYDVTLLPKEILALVGRNNSGKSNIIKALSLFFDNTGKGLKEECFYNHITEEQISIYLTFVNLSDWEKEQFKSWMDGDKLVVGKEFVCESEGVYKVNAIAVTRIPESEWLQDDQISGEKISEWWKDKDKLKVNNLDFGFFLTTKPTVAKYKEIVAEFIKNHRNEIPYMTVKRENPKGYPGVLKGALPEFIYVPAVRDLAEETKVAKTNPFGQLINSVLEKIADKEKQIIADQLKEVEKRLNRAGGENRIGEIKAIEGKLNKLIAEIMECDIEIEMGVPELKEIFTGVKVFADDGIRTEMEAKGHGLQRSMIFTILRAYAELAHSQKTEGKPDQRSTIFAIEEPELYLHPQSQRTIMEVFRAIAAGNDQVIYCTHSSLFVDIAFFDQICICRKERVAGQWKTILTQLSINHLLSDLKIRKGVVGTEEGIRELYSHAFNPMINEGFFANKIIIVEGPSEQYLLPIYADILGLDLDQNNISVVHSDGKGPMDRLLRIFNGFKIPTYLWFDGDKNNKEKEIRDKTIELIEMLGGKINKIDDLSTSVTDEYAVLEFKLEETLKQEINQYEEFCIEASQVLGAAIGKPLLHRYMAKKISQLVVGGAKAEKLVPATITKIVGKIKTLELRRNVLKS